MKLILLLTIILSCCTTHTLQAQEQAQQVHNHSVYNLKNNHELRIGVGVVPMIVLTEFNVSYDRSYNDYSSTYYGDKTYCPAINLTYSYQFRKWLSFGAVLTYVGIYQNSYNVQTDALENKWRQNYIGITPTLRFDWLNTPTVKLYSSFGLGFGINFDRSKGNDNYISNEFYPSFDLTGLGITVGRRFFGFSEISLSTNGFYKVGVGYRFNYKNK